MTNVAKSGHPGGPLSAADYLTVLFWNYLRIDPKNPHMEPRDRFILSNGHCSALNYALLARRGFFNPGYLLTFRSTHSRLQGHPNMVKLAGLEMSTGSLGHGQAVGHGMALGAKLLGSDVRVFVNCGDGELQEGSAWEAFMAAGHYKSDNYHVLVDYNDVQIDGHVEKVMGLAPLDDKFRAFRFHVFYADGHDMADIIRAYDEAIAAKGKPKVILFKTKMMHGVPEFEDQAKWHGKFLDDAALDVALKSLGYTQTREEIIAEYGEPVYELQ